MFLPREYKTPIALRAIQPIARAARKLPSELFIGLILAFGFLAAAQEPASAPPAPPANLAKLIAHRESETEAGRAEYTYRQTVTIEEPDDHGGLRGQYRETRDIIFSPG